MREFLNALQAASNTAAGTVSGPVDMLAWALRKAGIPVPEDALGSSEWMRRQGLMADVRPGVSQMVGDTVGLLSPVAAAAYGPQIARGLLKGGENLAQPRTLNPETGAIVWHGSPHKFDKFDSSKIGTGEGAQAYGHGLYLADAPEVSQSYINAGRSDLSKYTVPEEAVALFNETYPSGRATFGILHGVNAESLATWLKSPTGLGDEIRAAVPDKLKAAYAASEKSGNLYKVDLPDEAIAKMLDWDKPMNQQTPEVLSAFKQAAEALPAASNLRATLRRAGRGGYEESGADFYRRMHDVASGRKDATETLRQLGIPGIRYLDGGSRAAGQGSSNYVVFPGEEGLLKILERNGQGLLGP